MKWLPVSECLPQESQRVLIFYCGHQYITSFWSGEFIMASNKQPTHWMPLPPPPGQERDHSELVKRLRRDVQWIPGKHYVIQLEEIMDQAADALEGK